MEAAHQTYVWLEQAIEGSRSFDVLWGTTTAAILVLIGWTALLWTETPRRVSIFGESADPKMRLQISWAVFALAMAGTNVGCRYIPHAFLEGVHLGYASITLAVILVLGPRELYLAIAGHVRRIARARAASRPSEAPRSASLT